MPTIAQGSDEMESKIDWSKAPKWATRLMRNKYWCPNAWADDHKDAIWVTDYESGSDMIFNLDPTAWDLIENRPTTPSWSGEGLPPVGVVCEYNPMPNGKPKKWHRVEVVYSSEWVIVMRCIEAPSGHEGGNGVEIAMAVDSCSLEDIRPIRTPEQIAADEREAAIKEIASVINIANCMDCGTHTATAIYDAGYRKEQK